MAEFALEYVVKITILIVAAVVIIGLILTFQEDILNMWPTTPTTVPPKAQVIEKDSFTDSEVASFIAGCWSTNQGSTKDTECYFLLGGFTGVTKAGIVRSEERRVGKER